MMSILYLWLGALLFKQSVHFQVKRGQDTIGKESAIPIIIGMFLHASRAA